MGEETTTSQDVHTLILGTGPAGLAAGYRLAREGLAPLLLEKDRVAGGLMRSIRRGQFIVDIGRKELYSRMPAVDQLWTDILGGDYHTYRRRIGILHDGRIVEASSVYRGIRRGMPWALLLACSLDLLWCWAKRPWSRPRNYEEYVYGASGRRFSRILAQGFWEKFRGEKWAETPLPQAETGGRGTNLLQVITGAVRLAFKGGTSELVWRHPANGTGQICELLERHIRETGGCFQFQTRVTGIALHGNRISGVHAEMGSSRLTYRPVHVVSSLPLEYLGQLLLPESAVPTRGRSSGPGVRSTILVYLFLEELPRFPHVWLEVTCPKMRAGRVTNYAGFGGRMVPPGQTCLCVEFFCVGGDPLLSLDEERLRDMALAECARAGLVDPRRCFDHLVLKLPGADAATAWRDWLSEDRKVLLTELKRFENLYYVNLPGTDKATDAGLAAAEAILSGNRAAFDHRTEPRVELVGSTRRMSPMLLNP